MPPSCARPRWPASTRRGRPHSGTCKPTRGTDTMTLTTFDEFVELAKRGTFVPVCKELMADLLTPVSAFLKIAEHSDYAFLLESVEGGEHVGRYSFLGKDPFLILRARGDRTTMERGGAITESDRPALGAARRLVGRLRA